MVFSHVFHSFVLFFSRENSKLKEATSTNGIKRCTTQYTKSMTAVSAFTSHFSSHFIFAFARTSFSLCLSLSHTSSLERDDTNAETRTFFAATLQQTNRQKAKRFSQNKKKKYKIKTHSLGFLCLLLLFILFCLHSPCFLCVVCVFCSFACFLSYSRNCCIHLRTSNNGRKSFFFCLFFGWPWKRRFVLLLFYFSVSSDVLFL